MMNLGPLKQQFQVFVKSLRIGLLSVSISSFLSISAMAAEPAVSKTSQLPVKTVAPIFVDENVPLIFKNLIYKDLSVLDRIHFRSRNIEARKIFQTYINNSNMKKWLYDRSRFILSEQFVIDANTTPVFRNNHIYVNPTIPQFERGKSGGSSGPVRTIMSNIGAQVYYSGKTQNALFQMQIPGFGFVPVRSPRVGIFKIGAALFQPLLKGASATGLDSIGHSLSRLKTYFHEARHSDGNGNSLLFGHAVCPEGHDFAGYNACDKNLNGPYTVGALFLSSTISSCFACTSAEKEALRVEQLDSFSRVIKTFTRTTSGAQSALADSQSETCNQLRMMKVDLSRYSFCTQAPQSRVETFQEKVKAEYWDPNPETAGPLE